MSRNYVAMIVHQLPFFRRRVKGARCRCNLLPKKKKRLQSLAVSWIFELKKETDKEG